VVEDFEIIDVSPKLLLVVMDGGKAVVNIVVKVPSEGYKGNLKVTVFA